MITRRSCVALLMGAALAIASMPALAHHSAAMFEEKKTITVEGVVKEFQFTNPHSWLIVDVTDKSGETKTWALEWGSTNDLTQASITRTTLKPGDRIIVTGEPARDQSSLRLLIVSVNRPSDGFSWRGRVE